jgi:hypothetical protein
MSIPATTRPIGTCIATPSAIWKLLPHAHELAGPPKPGDVAVFRYGRTYSHGAIVIAWPRLIHAYWQRGVVWGDATLYPLAGRPVRFFGVIDD